MNGEIFKTIFDKEKGQWVVVSELAKGKTKSSRIKIPTFNALIISLSAICSTALATPVCDDNYECQLATTWSYPTANNSSDTLLINDANAYIVNGPSTMKSNITFPIRKNINLIDAWDNNWATGSGLAADVDPSTLGTVHFSNEGIETVTVTNAAGITETVNLYSPDKLTLGSDQANRLIMTILDPSVTSIDFYYDAGFVKVTNGEARVRLDQLDTITTGLSRNTVFALADGTGTTESKVIWESSVTYAPTILKDNFSTSDTLGTTDIPSHQFLGTFNTYDGSSWTVNTLDEYKDYLRWLNDEVKAGRIKSADEYESARSLAYTTNIYSYDYDIPGGTGPAELYQPKTGDALLMAKGAKATVEVAAGVTLTQKAGVTSAVGGSDIPNNDTVPYGMILMTQGGQGYNKGTLQAHGGYSLVSVQGTDSRFVNETSGKIEIGSASLTDASGQNRTQTLIARDGGEIVNQGEIVHFGANSSTTEQSVVTYVYNKGKFVNDGQMSFAAAEKPWANGSYHTARMIALTGQDSQFINSENGVITLGIDPTNNSATGLGLNSFVLRLDTQNSLETKSENKGHIQAGGRLFGSNLIYSISNQINYFTNSGEINLDGNRDVNGNASADPAFNVAMYRANSSANNPVDFVNTGTINVDGYGNIALKAVNRGKISSSGTINVKGNKTDSGLNNYGAWVEGNGSVIDISGDINLMGDNSIGAYADSRGTISLSGNGQVNFLSGENQIGYYVYGAGSKINNASTGSQDVTTKGSTLMRLDGGASFLGSSDSTSTMSASGENSNVIVATGLGTSVNSGAMTVNVTGKNATGFLVEGGATGTIQGGTNSAQINLSSEGAIAGIADGQGHDLTGAEKTMTDVEKKATSLTAGANLNSTLNGVVGYIARNLATLTNSGSITFSGDNTTGIQVEEGAVGINRGNITLGGVGSVGLKASANTLVTTLSSTGNLTLNGSWDGSNDATRTTGVLANGSQVSVTIGDGINAAAVNLNGSGSVGVHASAGSVVTLNDKVAVNFDSNNTDQIAFWVDGSGSQIITHAGTSQTQVNGDGATLFYVTDNATLDGVLNLNLSGKAGSDKTTSGIRVSGVGSLATLTAGSQLTIGTNATGVLAENAGQAVIEAGATFNTNGNNAIVGKATGENSRVENKATVTSGVGSSGSTAFLAENGGTIENKGNINLSVGTGHTAIDLNNGHLDNTGNIQANGTVIHIKGTNSTITNVKTIEAVDGKAAIHVDAGAGLNLSAVSGKSGTIKASGTADGILLSQGAVSLNVANTLIDMSDANASGIGIHNVAGIEGIKLDNTQIKLGGSGIGIKTGASLAKTNSGQIDVTDGTGILYLNEDGSAVSSDIDFSDSANLVINVAGQGVGVKATLDGNDRTVNTGVSVNITTAAGGSAIDVSGAKIVANSGTLISDSTLANGNVLNVHNAEMISNSGTINASSADLAAIGMSNAGNKTFTNTGDIIGLLDFATGDNLINLTGGTLTGNIKANGGANTLTASAGSVMTGEILLTGANAQTVTVKESSTVGNITLGDGANQITIDSSTASDITTGNGNSVLTFSGNAVADGITLGTGNNNLILSGSANIASMVASTGGNNAVLVKDSATFGTLDAGTGGDNNSLTFDGADYTLANAANIQHFDQLNLINGADFSTEQVIQMGDTATSAGRITIDDRSSLVFTSAGAYTLKHALSGNGLVDVQSGSSFDFGVNVGNQFAGHVQMNTTEFTLSGLNTAALTEATLSVMDNNTTTVGAGNQVIGGLIFDGGTVDFGVSIPNDIASANRIQANTLDVSGTGKVKIKHPLIDNGIPPVVGQERGLLDQQIGTLVQLVAATTVTGAAGNLELIDENGNKISDETETEIYQNGIHAADGHYDYRLTTKDMNDDTNGLYVSYGLTQLDLLTRGTNELVINTDHSIEKVLSAKLTGSGDLGIVAGNGADALVLSNSESSYTGVTDLKSGTVKLGSDNGFGATSTLSLADTTTADINGNTQTIGALDGKAGSTLNLNGGNLTLTNGGAASGTLMGHGSLTVAGGILTVTQANANLSATTTVNAGAEALLEDVLALGTGDVVANGDVTLDNASGIFANSLSGNGQLNIHNGSDARLSGNNTHFSGIMEIDAVSTLTVSETQQLGATLEVKNANQLMVNNSAAMTLATIVSGTGDLIKLSSGTLTLSGTNTYTGNTDIQGGTVAISADANLGSASNQTLLNGGNLQITANLTTDRNIILAKDGSLIVDSGITATMSGWNDQTGGISTLTKSGNGTLIWIDDNSANTAKIGVEGGTLQVENLTQLASASGVVDLGAGGTLFILKSAGFAADVDFTRQLTGSGTLKVGLGDKDKDFTFNASAIGGGFNGTVAMDNGRFVLDNNADAAMGLATLALNGNAANDTLGSMKLDGSHTMGGLTINGGRLEVDYSSTDHRPEGFMTVNTLDTTGGGSLSITTPANLPNPLPVTGASLFDQNDNVLDQIVAATTVNGDGSQLALTNNDGTPVAPDTIIGLIQGGTTAGNAHYNYFGAVKSDGLYLGYGLTQIDAFTGQSVILSNAGAVDNKLGAKLTGDGGFTVNASGTVHIGNAASNYAGATDINSGKVVLITDNGFGQTSVLNMQAGTAVDLNGNSQNVGQLSALIDSLFDFNHGELTIADGGQVDGMLTGDGQLNLTGGTLNVTQNNDRFTGNTDIASGVTAHLTQPKGLGNGIIHNEGILNLDTARGTMLNNLSGSGEVTLINGADISLRGNNTGFDGRFSTNVGTTLTATASANLGAAMVDNAGTLVLDTSGLWDLTNDISGAGSLIKRGAGTVRLEANNVSAGLTDIESGLLLIGRLPVSTATRAASAPSDSTSANLNSDVIIRENGALGGYGTVTGNVDNRGNLIMGHALTGEGHGKFTIDGNYIGNNNAMVIFDTNLDDDSSSTDRLIVTGNTSGSSKVTVMSARGDGAQTEDGIKLIEVQGSDSSGKFTLNGRAVAGAYEYFLHQGAISTPTDGDWYLRSSLSSLNPDPSIYRPEAGGYLANTAAAGKLFNLRLADREGRAENSSMWLRQVGSRTKHRDSTGQLRTSTNSYVIQGGGEVLASDTSDTGRFGLGIMVAYGKADSKSNSRTTGYKADSTVDGYSTGLYGTWYQDAKTLNGAYVDSWVQYSWLDAEVSGQDMAKESYDMDGLSASVEAGYRLPVYQGLNSNVFITPQAQVIWSGIKADDHREANGTRVTSEGNNNVQTRLGMKVSRDGVSDSDEGKDRLFIVYAEANWLYNSEQAGAKMDGITVKQAGSRNIGELKLGTEGQLSKNVNLWSNVAQQLGDDGYSDTAVTIGFKYKF